MLKEYFNKIIDSNHDKLEAIVKVDGEGNQVIYIYSIFCKGVIVNDPEDRRKIFRGLKKGFLGLGVPLPTMIASRIFKHLHNNVYADFFWNLTIFLLAISVVWYFYSTLIIAKDMKWTKLSYSAIKNHK